MPSYVERCLNHIWLLHKRAVQLGQAVLLNFKQSYGLKPVCVKCTIEWLSEGLDWSSMKSTSENSTMSRCQSASWSTKHTKAWAKTHCRIQNLPLSSEEDSCTSFLIRYSINSAILTHKNGKPSKTYTIAVHLLLENV